MRIAVDAHAIGRKLTGNETYARNLLREYAAAPDSNNIVCYVSSPSAELLIPPEFEVRGVSSNPFVRLGYQLAQRVREDKADLLHVQYTAPLACSVPVVVTVHDVSFLDHPNFFSRARATQLKYSVKRTVKNAARIIAPSKFSRDRIAAAYGINRDLVDVIQYGVDPRFRPIAREKAARHVLDNYRIAWPYVLTVGDLQPRKNQVGLVRAFAALLKAKPDLPHHLVLVGKENWHGKDVRDEARQSGIQDRIHFTGFAGDEDLPYLYSASDLFVFPSFYEGFGLPILEAMACGTAVACSGTSSMFEVADSAAVLFDPAEPMQITRAMYDLLMNPRQRTEYQRLGHLNAEKFDWRRAASETRAVYERALGERKQAEAVAAVSNS